jgi:dihydropteroate synthase
MENNFEIIKNIHSFTYLGFPLMLGASRKSFTGSQFDTPAEDRLEASLAVASYGALHGVNILRVHDVAKTIKAIQMIELIKNA